ncbi:NAD-dependent epimerase/dehydratase family protein [Saccharibacillus qingshengii]|uniref:NAD-dependent epimerase/dehydratase family protein n=1 Tax=Saccharibacillus qingshengii TaxID=1763540 RepID=UPI00155646D2|nr:NAD-dependent epimerase/dehydratase family protein [Saccharibacillus qingshengii]
MKVLVTGATGFLGGRLARSLVEDGHEVTGLGRGEEAGRRLERDGIRFIRTELGDAEAVNRAVSGGFDIALHCGAHSASWGRDADFWTANVTGTANIAQACLLAGVSRLVHVSTPSLCFGTGERLGVRETDPLPAKQISAYARTKLLAEREIDRARRAGLRTLVIRPRALYGPGDRSILPRLIEANRQTGVPFIGGGRALIDLTYVDDAVQALKLAAFAPNETPGSLYHVSGGAPIAFEDAAERLFAKLERPLRIKKLPFAAAYAAASVMETAARLRPSGGEPMLTRALVGMLGSSQTLDIGAAREKLGYKPLVGIEEGLDRFVEWYKAQEGGSID